MKFQNLSVKRLFGRVAMGLVLSMSGITIALFFVTKQIAVLLTGGALLLCAIVGIFVLTQAFGKRLSQFTTDLCQTLDHMIAGNEAPQRPEDSETQLARIGHRLARLYQIMQENRRRVDEERQELQTLVSDISHQVKTPVSNLKMATDTLLITCHLGNGSSIAAVDQGKVVDTSMGMTPLAGLMMGTRCGDIDPSVVNYLKYTLNITGHQLDEILNKKSGLLGVSGVSSDKRDVEAAAAAGNPRAQLASDMLNYQIKKTIGSYIAAMGGVDAIVFTGGIGEHDADSRAKICHHMDWLGIRVDTDKNANAHKQNKDVVEITAWGAKVRTLVIETNEELMIARDTKEVLGNEGLL